MGPCSRPHCRKRRSAATRPIGEKMGSKRHLLVDGRGAPLSLVVTGANAHDATQLDAVLQAIMVKRKMPSTRRSKHLWPMPVTEGGLPRGSSRATATFPTSLIATKEADAKRRDPTKKARRWVVEVCHSWLNRFRKLLVRYEKLERSFVALNHIAAAITAFRKVKLSVNIIYGYALGLMPNWARIALPVDHHPPRLPHPPDRARRCRRRAFPSAHERSTRQLTQVTAKTGGSSPDASAYRFTSTSVQSAGQDAKTTAPTPEP